eukprot:jgi/Galph1/1076/GphlegSOOS_G5776.1
MDVSHVSESTEETKVATQTLTNRRVIVIGGGLAGALVALFLVRRLGPSYTVEIYEKRKDPRTEGSVSGRSINLALSTRGFTALEKLGLSKKVLALGVPMYGRGIHHQNSRFEIQPYGCSKKGEYLTSVSRRALNCLLLDACEEADVKYFSKRLAHIGNNVVHFEESEDGNLELVDYLVPEPEKVSADWSELVDTERESRNYKNPANRGWNPTVLNTDVGTCFNTSMVSAEIIIGADGVFSKVRQALENQTRCRFNYSQVYLSTCYKELTIPCGPSGTFLMHPNCLHIWPRGSFMLIALPNLDGSFTCTLFMDETQSSPSFKEIETEEQLLKLFSKYFKDVIPLMPNLVAQYFHSPLSYLLYSQCFPYHFEERILLIGDAAHAIVPFYGQGCNLAFEDCRILDELLQLYGDDWTCVLEHFTKGRKPHADVISLLALNNYLEMAQKTTSHWFIWKKKLQVKLSEWFPSIFPSLYRLVSFTNTPYKDALTIVEKREKLIRHCAISSLTLAIVVGIYGLKHTIRGM